MGGRGGEGVMVEGGSLGKRLGGGIAEIAINCGGGVGKQHFLSALARRSEEGQGEHRGKGTSAATTGNLLPAGNCFLARGV